MQATKSNAYECGTNSKATIKTNFMALCFMNRNLSFYFANNFAH